MSENNTDFYRQKKSLSPKDREIIEESIQVYPKKEELYCYVNSLAPKVSGLNCVVESIETVVMSKLRTDGYFYAKEILRGISIDDVRVAFHDGRKELREENSFNDVYSFLKGIEFEPKLAIPILFLVLNIRHNEIRLSEDHYVYLLYGVVWEISEDNRYEMLPGHNIICNCGWSDRVKKIKSVSELMEDLKNFKNASQGKDKFRFWYRGHSSPNFRQLPSVFREECHMKRESELLYDIYASHPEEFENCKTTFDRISKAQHYGLPTRLLDITESPLVALYFACEGIPAERGKSVGELIVYEPSHIYRSDEEEVRSRAELARLNYDEQHKCNGIEKPIFVKPTMNNDRIKNQRGGFILFGSDESEAVPYRAPKIYLIDKRRVIKDLDLYRIDEEFIYPDLEHSALAIKERYKHV